jgi:transcriptional regulator with XRE-family HTH domain
LQCGFNLCYIPHTVRYDFKKLKAAREQKLMTMTELAEAAGISLKAVSKIEQGKAPWIKAIRKVAAVLGVTNVVLPERRGGRRVA